LVPVSDTRTTVYLAEDHPLYLESLLRILGSREEVELVGWTSDGIRAWQQIQELRPQLVVLDIQLPRMTGLEILKAIRHDGLDCKVMILSGDAAGDQVFDAVRLGVNGYISKDATRDEIADAVSEIARGGTVLASLVQQVLADEVRDRVAVEARPSLSPREHQILRLIADGKSGPAIARELQIGAATVKTHTQNVYAKLGVPERAAAVAEAMRRGLLD
jgi:two-component system nitrate/nitrite response regulator NarL